MAIQVVEEVRINVLGDATAAAAAHKSETKELKAVFKSETSTLKTSHKDEVKELKGAHKEKLSEQKAAADAAAAAADAAANTAMTEERESLGLARDAAVTAAVGDARMEAAAVLSTAESAHAAALEDLNASHVEVRARMSV